MDYGFWSVIPPLAAIILALVFKNVFIALFIGIFIGFTVLSGGNIFLGIDRSLMSLVEVFQSTSNTIVIIVVSLIGGMTLLIERSGGIEGFVEYMTIKREIVKSKKGANLFTFILGVLIFTSGSLSTLVTGTVARPLSDAMKVPHEKLSYIVHSTSTPICVLIPLSGWGAFMIGLLQAAGVDNAPSVLVKSILLNFYCILAVVGVLFFVLTEKDFGPMKRAEERAAKTGLLDEPKEGMETMPKTDVVDVSGKNTSALNLVIPLFSMIIMIVAGLFITGKGNLLGGDGMRAILWGVSFGLLVSTIMYTFQKIFNFKEILDIVFKGTGDMLSVSAILIFAFAMGDLVGELDTGKYLASLFSSFLKPTLLPTLVFLITCIISFATGTSMGTMAVMMPLAMPMAFTMGTSIPLVASAVFGGSIFGDHASPISDTTIMSCSTSGCDVMDHIRSQLPYTLVFAGISIILYIVAGIII
ncbi:Na+/H+ antiporter NhaC family protein [Wansuia hejianensis]|uniref:Sodium:solute symporter n=1 Tax=Wansuia hejianensis TaxID=2763667 RepID=A0A926F0R1_9FIRM|nr:Na+/H+ antiporter NhaC family protein [Wansuia hejianensis]MBC8589882.1 sodium:solute symporter [Wansuia hejianensis]